MLNEYSTVLVTGGLGFVGRHLVNELLALGKKVTILDKQISSYQVDIPQGTEYINADIRDPKQLEKALKGIDIVFHLAANANGSISIENPRFDFEINVVGTFNMVEAAINAKVKRFYYMSSASVYGIPQYVPMDELHPNNPFVPYGSTKLSGERVAIAVGYAKGLPVVAGRPFCVYGPGENPKYALVEISRFLRWHLNGKPITIVGNAKKKTRDFIHVSDAVSGILHIADKAKPGEVFNIGSGTEISMYDVVKIMEKVTGKKAKIEEIPEITDDTYRLICSIEKLKKLGYKPKMSIENGIRQLVEYLGENPELPVGETVFTADQIGKAE